MSISKKVTPFFSVVIPTYNREQLIKKAIGSVVAQTYKCWELIVVDDGSVDNTKKAVTYFNDLRIKYIYQQNCERSVARNNGVNQSEGKYICFLDSDDYYLNNHLENLHQIIEASGSPEAVFITDVVREEKGKLTEVGQEKIDEHVNSVCYILCSRETVIPARVAIHSKILKDCRFNNRLKISEDTELFTRIGKTHPFIQVPRQTVVYHLHDNNSTNKLNNPFIEQLVALNTVFSNPNLKSLMPMKIKHSKLSKCYYGIAQYHENQGQHLLMIWALIKSLALDFFSSTSKARLYLILKYFPAIFR